MIDRHAHIVLTQAWHLIAGEFTGQVIDRHPDIIAQFERALAAGEFTGQVIDRHLAAEKIDSKPWKPANSPAK